MIDTSKLQHIGKVKGRKSSPEVNHSDIVTIPKKYNWIAHLIASEIRFNVFMDMENNDIVFRPIIEKEEEQKSL